MRSSPIITAFNAGELSPQLRGRIDLEKYAMGCKTLENFFCRAHGGVQRRPGSYFIGEVKTSAKKTRLIPFQFNVVQAYILEFGDRYIRFYKDYAQLEVSGTPYEIVSPYLEADLFSLQYAQDSDIMYITHPSYPVYKLSRTAHTAWTLEPVEFYDGPYLDQNDTTTTLTAGATTGTGIALVASANLFEAGHVGAYFRILAGSPATWGHVIITYVSDAKNAVCDIITDLGAVGPVDTWREGAWSIKNGYPATCAFNEQRLVLAGSTSYPQTIWASVSGDYEDMTPGSYDDDAFAYTIADQEVNSIRWLSNLSNLIIGTTGGEARLGQQDSSSPVTPSNAKITFQSHFGSAPLRGISMGSAILFWERRGHPANYGERLRELSYNVTYDSYVGVDLTIMAEHIAKGGVVDHALQPYPYRIMWCARADGTLVGMTYERDQNVVGWHRHPMTNGFVESVACIPGAEQDDVYIVVKRTINGSVKRYIEVLEDFDWGEDQEDCFFVDCGLTYDGSVTDTLSGLDHLEGEEVDVLTDGAVHPACTVISGTITLEWPASVVHVGLHYDSILETMGLEGGSREGSAQGKQKRVHEVAVRFYNTLGGKVGSDENTLDTLGFRTARDLYGNPPALFTGDKELTFPGGWDSEATVMVVQDQPLPMTILSLMPRFRTEDR